MSNIVPSSDGSGFSKSELALIKNGQWLPELSHFIPVTSPRNLDDNLNHARDEGEKIDLLIHTALNPHAPALVGLGEFLNSRDVTILAATLRGFASIGETLKEQNLDPDYRHHLEQIRYVLTVNLDLNDDDPSVHLFKRLCHDAESGGSEMVRWAAAHALQELDYPLNLRRQLLSRPPAEIVAEIWSRYESRLADGRRENDQSKVLEDIKFGIYGDTKKLFARSRSEYSLNIVRQVLRKSGMRGIRLAIEYGDRSTLVEMVNFAGEIFNQIAPNSQDKRYKDNSTRQKLANLLLPFLNISDLDLRNKFAEKLNDKRNQYAVSDRLIDQKDRSKVAVIDTDWDRAVALGDTAIAVLCEAVEGTLRIEKAENSNTNCQIESASSINRILTDVSRKAVVLAQYLQHDNNSVRQSVANLLEPHQSYLDSQSAQIIRALLFELDLPHESNISFNDTDLDKSSVESYIKLARTNKQSIQEVFANAISACDNESIRTREFITKQKREYLERIEEYLNDLNIWLKNYADNLQAKAKARQDGLERVALCIKLTENKSLKLYKIKELDQSIKLNREQIEKYQIEYQELSTKANRDQGENFNSLLFSIFVLPIVLAFPVSLLQFICWSIFVVGTGIMSWEVVGGTTFSMYIALWILCIVFAIGTIISTQSARTDRKILEVRRNEVSSQLSSLENQRNELKRELSTIENRMRENKCS